MQASALLDYRNKFGDNNRAHTPYPRNTFLSRRRSSVDSRASSDRHTLTPTPSSRPLLSSTIRYDFSSMLIFCFRFIILGFSVVMSMMLLPL